MKNYSGHDEPNHRDYDEDSVTDYQSDVNKYVDKSCADILAYFCKVGNKETGEHPKLSKFLNQVEIGKKYLIS